MKPELEAKIVETYPEFFPEFRGNPAKTCLAFGFEISDGWYNLFEKLCRDIKAVNPPEDFEFTQVKEKFGGLRAYFSGGNEDIRKLIDKAEDDSYNVCEGCGTLEEVTSEGAWIVTLCKKCRNIRRK